MVISEIQKKKEALRISMKRQIAELDAQEKKIIRLEREKEAERVKKNYESNRDGLAAILFKLHSKDFAGFDLSELRASVVAILNPLKPEASLKKVSGPKNEKSVAADTDTEIDSAGGGAAAQEVNP